jgi:hypothetical protein
MKLSTEVVKSAEAELARSPWAKEIHVAGAGIIYEFDVIRIRFDPDIYDALQFKRTRVF